MDHSKLWGWEVDGTGSRSCPVVGLGSIGVEPSDSATKMLVCRLEIISCPYS
jgi:hypothetical protein